jgi:hypothetical protein
VSWWLTTKAQRHEGFLARPLHPTAPEQGDMHMLYMLEVNVLIATIVFGFAGMLILGLFVWTQANKYAHALNAMRLTAISRREHFAISRVNSRNSNRDSVPVA